MREDQRDRLSELYEEHASRVYAYARRHAAPESAEDLVADAFIVAMRRIEAVPVEPDEARAWLIGTVRKLAANGRRRSQTSSQWWQGAVRDAWHLGSEGSAEDVVAERDSCLRLLGELTEVDREALLLIAWEGLSARQAAVVLGITPNAFSVRVHRARSRLEDLAQTSSPITGTHLMTITEGHHP
ncbi:RNA polymerase sigma factor [Nocardioides mangrovicus]|uniref:RNA polymerase sigma factor n=1 Tax=Nocardioides mangrovicus TaxID=2478913 RepID=A0A3L8NZN4_9ACTN|nr:RNA polymerase sigma factor [Nocardioides mangrovicus]RLV47759.1 RNA polymerase sigma factor [Nocardioides mangrovicus]